MKEVVIDGVKFLAVDFKNEWTLKHDLMAKPIIAKIYKKMGSIQGVNKLSEDDYITGINLASELIDIGIELDLLALLYRNEKEDKFDETRYEKRKKIFENMPIETYDKMKGRVKDFFDSRAKSITGDFQIYMTGT